MRSTRQDVISIIGNVDDFIIERILDVRASKAELNEAALILIMDADVGDQACPPSSVRVDTLCDIIGELLTAEEDDEVTASYEDSWTQRGGSHDRR